MSSRSILLLTVIFTMGTSCELHAQRPEGGAEVMLRLQSEVPQVRAAAALEMGELGIQTRPALEALGRLLADPDERVRRAAISALRQIDPEPEFALPALTRLLADANPAVAAHAAEILAGYGEQAVPYMIRALEHEDARYWACLVLSGIGPEAAPAVPALTVVLDSEEPETQHEAIMALAAIGPEAKAAVPALLEILKSEQQAMVISGTYALGNMGEAAQLATPALRDQMQTDNAFVRTVTAWALASVNPQDPAIQQQAIELLVAALGNPEDGQVRMAAARGLVALKPDHAILLPALTEMLKDSPPEVVADSLRALAAVGQPAVPGMIRMLRYEEVRPLVARVLAQLGPQAAEAVPALTAALAESPPETQREILFALGSIGPASQSAVPTIAHLLKNENPKVRYSAVYALGRIGPAAAAAAPAVRANLASEDPFYQMTSAWVLVRIDPAGPEVAQLTMPLLTMALEHDRAFVRVEAADALGRLGPAAASALPALQEAVAEDDNELVRQTATEAIAAIRS